MKHILRSLEAHLTDFNLVGYESKKDSMGTGLILRWQCGMESHIHSTGSIMYHMDKFQSRDEMTYVTGLTFSLAKQVEAWNKEQSQ